jgi:hypothetical protein
MKLTWVRVVNALRAGRDLAVNWNVDIANELEQYLNELEMIEISFDGGETTLNFAEAALLIQGSTCVYSRKVEYLYKLVFNVLDIIANRQKKADAMLAADPDSEFPAEPEFIAYIFLPHPPLSPAPSILVFHIIRNFHQVVLA